MEELILAHFSKLLTSLHTMCHTTNLSCQILNKCVFEHQNVLKTWDLPVEEEEGYHECACKPCFDDEPVELVKDLENAVQRAKATRKIVEPVSNVQLNKEYCKVNDITQEISVSSKEKQKINSLKPNNCRTIGDQVRGSESACSNCDGAEEFCMVTQSLPKKVSNIKLNKSRLQTTYQNDYSQHYSHLSSQSRKYGVKHSTNFNAVCSSSSILRRTPMAIDINNLLKQTVSNVTIRNKNRAKTDCTQQVQNNICLLHNKGSRPAVHRYLALKEAIAVLGVPSEFLKLLKTYYDYINNKVKWEVRKADKGCKNSFLEKLNESNQSSWQSVSLEPAVKLCLHYFHVFVEIVSENKTDFNPNLLKDLEEEFVILSGYNCKVLDNDLNSSEGILFSTKVPDTLQFVDIGEERNWALAGIWNRKCWNMFSDLKKCEKISYVSDTDCRLLQKNFQELQKLHFQIMILEVLHNDIFPALDTLSDDHVALAGLYKSCSALCNILSLSVPIFLKKSV